MESQKSMEHLEGTGGSAKPETFTLPGVSRDVPVLGGQRLAELKSHLAPEDLRELISVFLDEVKDVPARLRLAVSAGNIHKIKEMAHKFKGSCGTVGADRLFVLSQRIQVASEPEILVHGSGWISQIEAEFVLVREELDRLAAELGNF